MDGLMKASIFDGLDNQSILHLQSLAKTKLFDEAELIIEKGKIHDFFIILIKGCLDVTDQLGDQKYVVASLSESGEFVGGQSLLGRPASMNVEARGQTECLLFPLAQLSKYPEIFNALVMSSAVDTARKLESTNQSLLLQLKKASTASSTILLCLSGFSIAMIFLSFMASINYPTDGLWSWLFILFVIPPPLIFVAATRQPLATFGVSMNRFGESFFDGIIGSLIVICLAFLAINNFDSYFGVSVSEVVGAMRLSSMQTYYYLIHCYLQEFFVRGSIQTSLEEVIQMAWRKPLAVVLASAIFSVLHYPLGFIPIVATFASGLLFGFVYSRTRNLIGVTLIHYVSGKIFFGIYHALAIKNGLGS